MPVQWRGFTFDLRTIAMIRWAEKRAGFPFRITQGSYNAGGVSASAGTHDKAAVDIGVAGLHPATIELIVKSLKDAGFAAWHRTKADGFDSEHVHAIPLDGNLARVALQQQDAYLAGRDGLKDNGHDPSYRPRPLVSFSLVKNQPLPRKKDQP